MLLCSVLMYNTCATSSWLESIALVAPELVHNTGLAGIQNQCEINEGRGAELAI
jgi:hypothetical protein